MNKKIYSFGNAYKARHETHFCLFCNNELSIIEERKIVSQKSEEAKYYDFGIGFDGGVMIGPCEFIHSVFYCSNCQKSIEYITQLSFEDIFKTIKKVKKRFKDKIDITLCFQSTSGETFTRIDDLSHVEKVVLKIKMDESKEFLYSFNISRMRLWERPFYFPLRKRKLVKYIKSQID